MPPSNPEISIVLRLLLCAALALAALPARAEPLKLLLDWFVNPDHAPLIVAQQKGWFAAAGVPLTLTAPSDPNDPPKLLAAGQADLAISYQPQLTLLAAEGLPLARIATLVATPLNSLVVLADGPVKTLADLKGRKVGYSVGGFEDALLGAMLEKSGLKLGDVELVNVNFSLSPALLSGQVAAAIGAFRNFELTQMALEKHPGRAFFVEEEGVPVYDELVLIARRDRLGDAKLATVVAVIERATLYLLNHPEAAWTDFVSYDKALDDALNRQAFTDTMRRFSASPAALDRGRYVRFAEFLTKRGLIKAPPPVDSYAVVLTSAP
jgi:putative hydroxymethylpyrimidine transport system substrate-binding protein